jgi:6-pyruvoyltetrahydropterin/6-carboxytetrahydropterin synthase
VARLEIMPIFYLTRKEHFNAAHKLYNPAWSKEKNNEVFGKCANDNWHGHNFELFVTVKGSPDPETGFIVDAKLLSKLIKEYVVDVLDHRNLNLDVPFMKGKICSIENLVFEIWQQLAGKMPAGVSLHCIKLVETPRIYVEYFGE